MSNSEGFYSRDDFIHDVNESYTSSWLEAEFSRFHSMYRVVSTGNDLLVRGCAYQMMQESGDVHDTAVGTVSVTYLDQGYRASAARFHRLYALVKAEEPSGDWGKREAEATRWLQAQEPELSPNLRRFVQYVIAGARLERLTELAQTSAAMMVKMAAARWQGLDIIQPVSGQLEVIAYDLSSRLRSLEGPDLMLHAFALSRPDLDWDPDAGEWAARPDPVYSNDIGQYLDLGS